MTHVQCFERFKRFKWSILFMDKNLSLRWTSTITSGEKTNAIQCVISEKRRLTMQKIVDKIETSVRFYHAILTEKLDMHCITAKLVPKLLQPTKYRTVSTSYMIFQIKRQI